MGVLGNVEIICRIIDENDVLEHHGPGTNRSHLKLDQLGRVLQNISSKLPGKTSFTLWTDFLLFVLYNTYILSVQDL